MCFIKFQYCECGLIIAPADIQARAVRNTAHAGGMSDSERRRRAAEMATRFAEMMLPAGESDDSDEGEP